MIQQYKNTLELREWYYRRFKYRLLIQEVTLLYKQNYVGVRHGNKDVFERERMRLRHKLTAFSGCFSNKQPQAKKILYYFLSDTN